MKPTSSINAKYNDPASALDAAPGQLPVCLFLFAVGSLGIAQDADLQSLKERMSQIGTELRSPMTSLSSNYVAHLRGLMEAAGDAGNLNIVVTLEEEIAEIRSGNSGLPLSKMPHAALQRPKRAFRAKRAEIRTSAVAKYRKALEAYARQLRSLEAKHTKARNINAAKVVSAEYNRALNLYKLPDLDLASLLFAQIPLDGVVIKPRYEPGTLHVLGTKRYDHATKKTPPARQPSLRESQNVISCCVAWALGDWMALKADGKNTHGR